MVLDAFDSTAIKTGEEVDDDISKQFNRIKAKLGIKFKSLKLWLKSIIGHSGRIIHKNS